MKNSRLWIICSWLMFGIKIVKMEYQLPDYRWTGSFTPGHRRTVYHLTRSPEKQSIVTWHYDITVPQYQPGRPKPVFYFRQQQRSHERFNRDYTCIELGLLVERSSNLVILGDGNCNLENGNLRCIGYSRFAAAYPVYWQASVAYSCQDERPPYLNLAYDITLTPYANITCRNVSELANYNLPHDLTSRLDELNALYTMYSPWNFFGSSLAEILEVAQFYPLINTYTCYKYLLQLLVRLALPECRNGQVIYQCFEMCGDFREGCGAIDNALFTYTAGCFNLQYRGEGPCIYQDVTCDDELKPPSNGFIISDGNITLNSTRTFGCDPGFELSGNDTAVCGYGGTWETEEFPVCKHISKQSKDNIDIILIIAGVVIILIIALIFLIYIRYRYEVIVLIFKYCPWILCCARFHRRYEVKLNDAFVACHEDDEQYVKDNIEVQLEQQGYKLFVDYRDGPPGQPIMRYMADAIAQSQSVILVLSQQFLNDRHCEYMLNQTFYQTLEGQQFKVIVVQMAETKQLKNIPRFMRVFMRAAAIVHKDDPTFLATLVQKMPAQRVARDDDTKNDTEDAEGACVGANEQAETNLDSVVLEQQV